MQGKIIRVIITLVKSFLKSKMEIRELWKKKQIKILIFHKQRDLI